MKKRIMLLGGLRFLIPVIEQCHKMGIYVITADYLPGNIAHKFSDEYCNVSIIDKESVLEAARRLQIDGILSYAVDPGVVSAAYVAEQLGLPYQCSYETALVLQHKALFREYLEDHGFNCPRSHGYSCIAEVLEDVDRYSWPVIVKPVDSAGSKGVVKVENPDQLLSAFNRALSCSPSKRVIIEEFLDKVGEQSSADIFVIDEKLVYPIFSDQLFDPKAENPFTPAMEIWPSSMEQRYQDDLTVQLQRLISLLNIKSGLFNVESRVCSNGKAYIMEFSPRGGGNRIAEIQTLATGAPLIENEIRMALGLPLIAVEKPRYDGVWVNLILHTNIEGVFKGVTIDPAFRQYIKYEDFSVKPGTHITGFSGANSSLGSLFLRFEDRKQFCREVTNINQVIHILLEAN